MTATITDLSLDILAWSLGWQEMAFVLVALLLLFGGKKLPELARGLGKGLRNFKEELHGTKKDFDSAINGEGDEEENPEDSPYQEVKDSKDKKEG
jgi:TatA/E family protein of Tat protein translocase